jgi:uncharacterized protein (TIGR02453 family)
MGAYISPGGKKSNNAGYYIHIEPGNKSMLAGGMYTPMAPELKKIRQEIDYNTKTIKKILSDKDFKKYFGELSDMRLKRTPKGYAEDHPEINLLKQTSFIVVKKYSDKEVLAKNFVSEIAKGAKIMKPLCDFLNEAIK